jgi:hypothetical protein
MTKSAAKKFRVRAPSDGGLQDALRLLRRNLHADCSFESAGRLGDHNIKGGPPWGLQMFMKLLSNCLFCTDIVCSTPKVRRDDRPLTHG